MRRGLAVAVALTLSCLAACMRGGVSNAPAHVLRIAYAGDPASLVPLLAIDQNIMALDGLFCPTLVGLSADNRVVPLLVTRVPSRANGDVSPDGTRITYHLRHGTRFPDGVELTSADVAFTYHAILDPRNRTVSIEPYRRVVSLTTPDRYTVTVRLNAPWNAAVDELFAQGDYMYGILPKHAFGGTKVVGTAWESAPFCAGPFRVSSWRRGDRIVLKPNPYFRPRPKLTEIVMQIVPDLNSNFIALRSGAVDVGQLTPDNVQQAQAVPSIRVMRVPENATGLLYLNTRTSPTNDLRVRRAIAFALDPTALANAWRRQYPPATSFLAPPVVRWKNVRIPPYPHDLAAARRELRGIRTPLTALFGLDAENPIQVRIATLVQAQLAAVGLRVSIKSDPTRLWYSPEGLLRNGKATMMSEAWVGGSDPEQSLNLRCVQARPGDENHSFYCSRRFEALFDDQTRTSSEPQRDRDFNAMQRLVHADVPVIPLYYEEFLVGLDRRVTNYQLNMLRIPVRPELWDVR